VRTPTARKVVKKLRLKGKTYADTFDLESIQVYLGSIQFPESFT
jgi:hypothetical protein